MAFFASNPPSGRGDLHTRFVAVLQLSVNDGNSLPVIQFFHLGNLYATEKSSDNGVAAVENAVYFFARSEENSIVPTAQDGSERIGVDTEAGYER